MPAPVRLDAAFAVDGEPTPKFPTNRVQADVYRHILAWMPRARITDAEGRRWLVRTADEFRTLGKGLPWAVWTIQKAVRGLAADGWIEVRHGGHPFGRHEQPNCTWITLPLGAEHEGNPNVAANVALGCNQMQGQQRLEQRLTPQHSNVSLLHPRILPRDQGQAAPATPQGGDFLRAEAGEAEPETSRGFANMAKLADLAPTALKPKRKPDLSKPLKAEGLYAAFVAAYNEAFPDEMAPTSNSTRLGQATTLITYLRTKAGLSDAEIIETVEKFVREWAAFVPYLAKHGGPKIIQTRPSIASLTSFRDKAVNFRKHQAEEAAAAAAEGLDGKFFKVGLKP